MDIYEQIDNLYAQVSSAETETQNKAREIKRKDEKIKELKNICFKYAEEAYNLIGYLKSLGEDKVSSTVMMAIDAYKTAIDSCIADASYKDYLHKRYITKDLNFIELCKQRAEKEARAYEEAYVKANLVGNFKEDDTDTINIIDN